MMTGKELSEYKFSQLRGFQGIKETKVKIGNMELNVAVVNGLGYALPLMEIIAGGKSNIHFIEVMSCKGGCIAGGGQHIGADRDSIIARGKRLHDIDESENIKVSHLNPQVMELYSKFLEKPLGKKSHEYLHTNYSKRDVLK